MKLINAVLVSLTFISAMNAYAGGAGGNGGPPAKEAGTELTEINNPFLGRPLESIGEESTAIDLKGHIHVDDLLSRIPANDLLKGPSGSILIPLSEDIIRRLKLRASVTGSTPLILDNGEKFLLHRDVLKEKLVDLTKAAEVIEKSEGINP